jgi:hypothetical protein
MFGRHWKRSLASMADVSKRSVQYWCSGEHSIPDVIIEKIDNTYKVWRGCCNNCSPLKKQNEKLFSILEKFSDNSVNMGDDTQIPTKLFEDEFDSIMDELCLYIRGKRKN